MVSPDIILDAGDWGSFILDTESLSRGLSYLATNVERHDPAFQEISDWITATQPEAALESKQRDFHDRSYLMWTESIMTVIQEHYGITNITNHSSRAGAQTSPVYLHESFGDTNLKVPHRMTLFVEGLSDPKERMAITFYPYDKWDIEIRFHYGSGITDFNRLWEEIENHFYREGLLKGCKFDATFRKLKLESTDWDSVVISDGKRKLLERNVIDFLNHVDHFDIPGFRTSRGLLLAGPPGTGKTLTCRVIMNAIDATVIYVTRDHLKHVGDIDQIYRLARKLSPTLVVFEDIDTLGGIDRNEGDHPHLGEFLNSLSGVEQNAGVVTLATTNYPQNLDWALVDRPGRFDLRLDIDYPTTEQRREILSQYLAALPKGTVSLKPNIIKTMVQKTDGYSGAYLQELVQSAYMAALERVDYDKDTVWIESRGLEEAHTVVDRMRSGAGKPILPRAPDNELYG